MHFYYAEKDDLNEYKLYHLLLRLKKCPGVLIGEPSLTKLFHFISGYQFASIEMKDYRLYFDKEFQEYIKRKVPNEKELHWNQLLCEGRTESEAFYEFYTQLDSFFKEKNIFIDNSDV